MFRRHVHVYRTRCVIWGKSLYKGKLWSRPSVNTWSDLNRLAPSLYCALLMACLVFVGNYPKTAAHVILCQAGCFCRRTFSRARQATQRGQPSSLKPQIGGCSCGRCGWLPEWFGGVLTGGKRVRHSARCLRHNAVGAPCGALRCTLTTELQQPWLLNSGLEATTNAHLPSSTSRSTSHGASQRPKLARLVASLHRPA